MYEKVKNSGNMVSTFVGRIKRIYFIRGLGLGFLILNLWEAFWSFDRGKVSFALGHVVAAVLSVFVIFWTFFGPKTQ